MPRSPALPLLLPRLRSLLARHPSIYWAAVAMTVAVAVSAAWSAMGRVEAARRSWGEQRSVWMAAADVDAGGLVSVHRVELPLQAIPPDAVTSAPSGARAVQHIGEGEIVTAADLGSGVLAALPPGWRAIAVPTDPARLPAGAGDHVAVYANGVELVDDGIVIDTADGIVTVAVPASAAGAVSDAARNQTAVLALRRP